MEGCLSSYPVQALREKYLYNLFHSIIHRTRTDNLKICIEQHAHRTGTAFGKEGPRVLGMFLRPAIILEAVTTQCPLLLSISLGEECHQPIL